MNLLLLRENPEMRAIVASLEEWRAKRNMRLIDNKYIFDQNSVYTFFFCKIKYSETHTMKFVASVLRRIIFYFSLISIQINLR